MSTLPCKYGTTCFRLNWTHLARFRHEHLERFLTEIRNGKHVEELLQGMSEKSMETVKEQLQVIQSLEINHGHSDTEDEAIGSLRELHIDSSFDEVLSSNDQEPSETTETNSKADSDAGADGDHDNDGDSLVLSESETENESVALKVPPWNQCFNLETPLLVRGVISEMNLEDLRGIIRILPYYQGLDDISFDFEDVVNSSHSTVFLKVGSSVLFLKDAANVLCAKRVIGNSNDLISVPTVQDAPWPHGIVVSIHRQYMFASLRCPEMKTEVRLDLRKISEFGLPLKCGDKVNFLEDKKAGNPSALCAQVLHYEANRSISELNAFVDSCLSSLQSSKSTLMVMELSSLDSFWQYFGGLKFNKEIDLLWKILEFLTQFFKLTTPKMNLDHVLEILAQPSNVINQISHLPSVVKNFQMIFEFCEQIVGKCPRSVTKILPLMQMAPKPFMEKLMVQLVSQGLSCPKDPTALTDIKKVSRYLNCGHEYRSAWYEDISQVICNEPCTKSMMCTNNHPCLKKCDCQHPSPRKKKCGERITWNCSYKLKFTGACGHPLLRKCSEKKEKVICRHPCENKFRFCGHRCFNDCGKNCETGECNQCIQDVASFQEKARQKARELKAKLGREDFVLCEVYRPDVLFFKVEDHVTKYVQAMHNWNPVVTRIQSVKNLKREIAYEKCKAEGFGTLEDLKFHGTSEEGVNNIPREGFREPEAQARGGGAPKMFGPGIYFATDSSKSAQKMYTKNSNKLLLCQVFLGNSKVLHVAKNSMNLTKLRAMQCDSVFAPRGSAVKNDEFVVYNPDQVYVKYIIHFHSTKPTLYLPSPAPIALATSSRRVLKPSRHIRISNPDDLLYGIAESALFRHDPQTRVAIKSVEHVTNAKLEIDFQSQKTDFKKRGIPDDEVLAFFETDSRDIDRTLDKNLTLQDFNHSVYGGVVHFMEKPNFMAGYGKTLMLFKIIPGNEYEGNGYSWLNFQSKYVQSDEGPKIIVKNAKQFHPFCIYHLE
ncbi:uncharacterized protein LOC131879036 isoform X2 [Tigriopus californicus]|uniref:uncharacterized protein LOC131879036 isoform X2 n=1 Tax=Tigriopus californicus TaxID=6832 RepID=UPI0027DA7B9C|nr:uncharacterized protein LOC131879036 isoform X2 [Tigriopus californicus]